jgi:hypothetical protein
MQTLAEKAVADKLRAEIEAKRLAKARGRIAKMLAKKNGDTKRMPLSGRAALRYIDGKSVLR